MESPPKHDLERAIDGLLEDQRTLWAMLSSHKSPQPGAFREFLRHLEPNISAAIQQGRSVLGQLHVLQDVIQSSAAINSSLALDQVLEGILDAVIGFTGAERAYLMLQDKHTQELIIRAARNWDQKSMQEDTAFSSSIVEKALAQETAIVTIDAQIDQRFTGSQSVRAERLLSVVCIPMLIQGSAIGVLYADSRLQKDLFGADVIPLLTAFGSQAAIAIKNASEFEQVRDDLKEAQQEVMKLRVEIDRRRMKDEIDAVTGSDYFQRLAVIAEERRKKRRQR